MTTIDFTPSPYAAFGQAFQALLDRAHEAEHAKQPPRDYLGGSLLGDACQRALGYQYFQIPRDEGRGFTGQTLRIFERGHKTEEMAAGWIRQAGFTLVTEDAHGRQFGFGVARDRQTGKARISGHIDGALTAGPAKIGDRELRYPCLWENKALNNKNWKLVVRQGVRLAKPVYYAQVCIYQAYMDITAHPALFTCVNADTMEVHAELVAYDQVVAQEASDRGVTVISAANPEALPRVANTSTDYRCKFCAWQGRCWASPAVTQPAQEAPTWMRREHR